MVENRKENGLAECMFKNFEPRATAINYEITRRSARKADSAASYFFLHTVHFLVSISLRMILRCVGLISFAIDTIFLGGGEGT